MYTENRWARYTVTMNGFRKRPQKAKNRLDLRNSVTDVIIFQRRLTTCTGRRLV